MNFQDSVWMFCDKHVPSMHKATSQERRRRQSYCHENSLVNRPLTPELLQNELIQVCILLHLALFRHQHLLQITLLDPVKPLLTNPRRVQDPLLEIPLHRGPTHMHARSDLINRQQTRPGRGIDRIGAADLTLELNGDPLELRDRIQGPKAPFLSLSCSSCCIWRRHAMVSRRVPNIWMKR